MLYVCVYIQTYILWLLTDFKRNYGIIVFSWGRGLQYLDILYINRSNTQWLVKVKVFQRKKMKPDDNLNPQELVERPRHEK